MPLSTMTCLFAAIIILLHSASTGVSAATEDGVADQERIAVFAKADSRSKKDDRLGQRSLESLSCESNIGAGCWWDYDCCGGMECLGVIPGNWACGNTPGAEGEYCNPYYYCREDLVCYEGECTDYGTILENGSNGDCKEGSPVGEIKVMSYNLFLVDCEFFGIDASAAVPCQPADAQRERIVDKNALGNWFDQSEADVVLFQEVWNLHDEIINMMTSAGFCNYISSVKAFRENGAGLMIFSKYPIETLDFIDWYDPSLDDTNSLNPENLPVDKGVMYAKVRKDGQIFHITNAHTTSNSIGEMHTYRIEEFMKMRQLVREKNPSNTEIVLYGGDMNENKYKHDVDVETLESTQYYRNMLRELGAFEPAVLGEQQFSYDTIKNPLPASFQDHTYQELLDYVLVSTEYSQPTQSSCEVIPVMLSDHFPVLCTYGYNAGGIAESRF